MVKILTKSFLFTAILLFAVSNLFSYDYVETFTNHNAPTGTYKGGSFIGDNGFVWNYDWCRADDGYPINGKSLMFRSTALPTYQPRLYSNVIPGGITDFKVSLRKGFTGSGDRSVALYVNGTFIASSIPYNVNNEVRTFEVKDINIPGDVVIELRNIGNQFVIDDLSWTIFGKPGNGTPTRVRIVKTMPDNPIQGLPFKAVVQLVDDVDNPQKLSSNTQITLNLTKGNGSLNGVLTKVIPAGQTTIVFDNLTYSEDDFTTISCTAPNNKIGSLQFLRDIDRHIDFLKKPIISVDVYPYGHTGILHPVITAKAIGEYGLPYADFSGYKAYLCVKGEIVVAQIDKNPKLQFDNPSECSQYIEVLFDRGVASFNNVVFNTTGTFTIDVKGDSLGQSYGHSVNVLPQPTMSDIIIPKYIKGYNLNVDFGERMPNYALVRFDNLHPGVEYRYLAGSAEAVPSTKPITPGNLLAYNPYTNSYFYPASKDLTNSNLSSAFVPEKSSSYVWVAFVNTGNAEFNQGKDISWCVDLGTSRGSILNRYYSQSKSRNVGFSTACNTSNTIYATGLYDDKSPALPKNFLVFYDANNNPISSALVQENGSNIQTPGFTHQSPKFYADYEKQGGAFATFIPNNLIGGIRKVVEYDVKGNKVREYKDLDGNWAGYRTDDCGYGVNPPLPGDDRIRFQLPQIQLNYPLAYEEICNTDNPILIQWNSRGISTINIWVSVNGTDWQMIENNVDARKGNYDWYVPRGRFANSTLKFRFEVPEYPEVSFDSYEFRIYDEPRVTGQIESMNYCISSDVEIKVEAEGSLLTYQWYKDGKMLRNSNVISGINEPVLRFKTITHNEAGIYTAYVYGHKNCKIAMSAPIAVYPARPASITYPDGNITIAEAIGNTVTLNFKAHINGVMLETENLAKYGVSIKWYKKVSETITQELSDNDFVAGAKTNWLTIRNFSDVNIGQYYAEIIGLCNLKVTTPIFTLNKLDVTFVKNPSSLSICQDNVAIFEVEASSSSNELINYQWYFNNDILVESDNIIGTKSNKLTINMPDENNAGTYYAVAILTASNISVKSNTAELKVNAKANIILQPEAVKQVNEGEQLSLEVIAEGQTQNEELFYQWFFNEKAVAEETQSILVIDEVKTDNGGNYYCAITNSCGTIKSNSSIVTIIPKQTTDVNDNANSGLSISSISPNPAQNVAYFTINSNFDTEISVKLIDAQGNLIGNLFNGFINKGSITNHIDINSLGLANGTYFLILQNQNNNLISKFVVLK